ncbi:MAG: pyridoxal-phosphate dependent enzyme [Deltaproteobacteria bacterium]|nr:pyridoxal-phosphate dependent enzyme [Deltaproteobacteria bacterium]
MSEKEKPALFDAFPELEAKITRIPIGDFPTPVHELKNIGNGRLWVKRDDLTAKEYGGNKVRKLEFILGHARSLKKNHIVTVGGAGTNHGLATTIYAGKLGIKTTLILFDQPANDYVRRNMLLFHKYGAEIIYKRTMFKLGLQYAIFQRLKNPGAYFLYAGGSTVHGTLGFVNAAFELKMQIDNKKLPRPGLIVCPLGSNGTLAGLALGMLLSGLNIPVIGIRVTSANLGPLQVAGEKAVKSLMKHTLRFLQRCSSHIPHVNTIAPKVMHNYFGNCYGCETKEGLAAIKAMKDSNNIELEPTYTGKTFAAALDLAKDTSLNNEPILYWNTYSSADLSDHSKGIDYRELPKELHGYFE